MFNTENHDRLSIESILKSITHYDIFRHYITGFEVYNKRFRSELRRDNSPSCSIKPLMNGSISYKDHANGEHYNCFDYVSAKFGLSFKEALVLISNDFGLDLTPEKVERKPTDFEALRYNKPLENASYADIKICSVPFTIEGLRYWKQYGIDRELLELYNIKQIKGFYINHQFIEISKNEVLAFAYCFGNYTYKILRPYAGEWKWTSNCRPNTVQGFSQLPDSGDFLVITKSLKDVITLRKLGYYAVAPQSENTVLPAKFIAYIKKRWNTIILYYDNDVPGIDAANHHSFLYELPFVHNPKSYEKDASDIYQARGKSKLKLILEEIFTL